jgi:hypothetical protein
VKKPLDGLEFVFTRIFQPGLLVDDLWSLDSASLAALQPLHALVFLFKWVAGADERGGAQGAYEFDFPGFYMHQVSASTYHPAH